MTLVEVLERCPLYQWIEVDVDQEGSVHHFTAPRISAHCNECKVERSFGLGCSWWGQDAHDNKIKGKILAAVGPCLHCHQFWRAYILRFHEDGKRAMKAGQIPPWDLSVDKRLSRMLGEQEGTFKKGFICEAQGFGIGAYACSGPHFLDHPVRVILAGRAPID